MSRTSIVSTNTVTRKSLSDSDIVLYEITVSTAKRKNAGTDEQVCLEVHTKDGRVENFVLDSSSRNDFKPGNTDRFDRMPTSTISQKDIKYFVLRIYGDDAWLPAGVVIATKTRLGKPPYTHYARVPWGTDWLSTNTNDAAGTAFPAYKLIPAKGKKSPDIVEKLKTSK